MQPNSCWEIIDGNFVKIFDVELHEAASKSKALYELSQQNDFVFPKVISQNPQNSTLTYEYIQNMYSSRQLYLKYTKGISDENCILMCQEAGRVLGVIHKKLRLDSCHEWIPTKHFVDCMEKIYGSDFASFLLSTPKVCLHGDYGFNNVCIVHKEQEPKLVIIDPCPNNFITFNVNIKGTAYVDLSNFTACLDGLVPLRNYPKMHWHKAKKLKEIFLLSYEKETEYQIDRRFLSHFSHALTSVYFNHRFSNKLLATLALKSVYNGFTQNKLEHTI